MPKFKRGQVVIYLSSLLPQNKVIAEIEPKRWWHIQQRYLVEWEGMPGCYDRYKENQLMAVTEKNHE